MDQCHEVKTTYNTSEAENNERINENSIILVAEHTNKELRNVRIVYILFVA